MENIENLINQIGSKIKYYRTLNKISLSKLAKNAGISKSTLFGLEEGRSNPTISTLINIATTLNIDLNEIIGSVSDKNFKNSKLSLISKSSSNEYSLYRLTLAPYEVFKLNSSINSINITLISGELYLIDEALTLHQSDTIITNNQDFKALENGATATIKIYSKDETIYINKDILENSASSELLDNISKKSINSLITRAIFSSISPIGELNKRRYINYIELLEDKESHYYFYRKYLGLISGVKSFFNKEELNLSKLSKIENYINIATQKNQLSKKDLSILSNPLSKELELIIESELKNRYKNIVKIDSLDSLLNNNSSNNSIFYILKDMQSSTCGKSSISLVISIYRALEVAENIVDNELNSLELKVQRVILENLLKALYYAYNGYDNIAISYLEKIVESVDSLDFNNKSIVLKKLEYSYELIKKSISNYKNKIDLENFNKLKFIAKDLGFEIIAQELISPVYFNSGLYCFILKK